MADCNLCGDKIMWARTAPKKEGGRGSSMPLDLPPNPNGNCWVVDGFVHVASAEHQPPAGVRRYFAHFMRCKQYAAQKRVEKALRDAAKADT